MNEQMSECMNANYEFTICKHVFILLTIWWKH